MEIPRSPKEAGLTMRRTSLSGLGGISMLSPSDWPMIERIARESWNHGYADVLPQEQIDFMLQKSYSKNGILEAMEQGQQFFLLALEDVPVGFVALFPKTPDILRIEKLYLLPEAQGKGFGRELVGFAVARARAGNRSIVELNVNRGNKACHFYLKQGFRVVREVDIPYFGFVLDDYVMQLRVAV